MEVQKEGRAGECTLLLYVCPERLVRVELKVTCISGKAHSFLGYGYGPWCWGKIL